MVTAYLIAAIFLLPSDVDKLVSTPPPKPYYQAVEASDPSIPACQISAWGYTAERVYRPKTTLGEKLMALRNRAIAKGLRLLDADEISEEIRRRRGEID